MGNCTQVQAVWLQPASYVRIPVLQSNTRAWIDPTRTPHRMRAKQLIAMLIKTQEENHG